MSEQSEKTKARIRDERERQRDEYKKALWNSRVALIKKGQLYFNNKLHGEAAVSYEKYIKILEIIYECGASGLTPEMLKESARTNELSIIASIYWDLVRIYDTNSSLLARQKKAAEKLAIFAIYTPLYKDIVKKAELFQKQSRQPDLIKNMISTMTKGKGKCFIATSAFEYQPSFEVTSLRLFRDNFLKKFYLGRLFVFYYYQISPRIADFLDQAKFLKPLVRFFIRLIVKVVT